jgi:hypothetical protein
MFSLDDLVNKGILYNFFKNNGESCLIVTFNFAENKTSDELLFDIDDVMNWLSKLIIGPNFNIKCISNTLKKMKMMR